MNLSDVYRLEALLELAAAYPATLTAREVARRRGIPPTFLARLLGELAREEVLVTARGPHGGVRLGKPPGRLRLDTVLRPETAAAPGNAAVRWLERRLADAHSRELASLSLAALRDVERELEAAPTYEI